jgi:prepilin-type N-terminal cleavage/methylation domain-containing protein
MWSGSRMPRCRRDDDGFSLVELVVTMGIMAVAMVLATTAIVQVYRTVSATETRSDTQTELSRAFQRFDRELRYASWIAAPSSQGPETAGPWYVEFAGPDPVDCFQLRLVAGAKADQGVLQLYSWKKGSPPAAGAKGQTIASQIVTTDPAQPKPGEESVRPFFRKQNVGDPNPTPVLLPSAGAVGGNFKAVFQRLQIRLTTRTGTGYARIDTTFTALNTTDVTPATNACSAGRPTP